MGDAMKIMRTPINYVLATVAVGAALLLTGSPAGAQLYTLIDLGSLDGLSTFATAVNDVGQVVGHNGSADGLSTFQAFLYTNSAMIGLGTAVGIPSIAYGINDTSQVVGKFFIGGGYQAFLYSNGTSTTLPTLGRPYATATAINDVGVVVGYTYITEGTSLTERVAQAFIYSNGTLTDLGTLGGTNSRALGVNNAGQVVGYYEPVLRGAQAFVYSSGTLTELGTLGGTSSWAHSINTSGQVVGYSATPGNESAHAFLYTDGRMSDIGTLGGIYTRSLATGINDAGHVVGYSYTEGVGTFRTGHAFVYRDGVLTDLNRVLNNSGTGWTLHQATAISNEGQIVGYGTNAFGQAHAYILTPSIPNASPVCGSSRATPAALWAPTSEFVPVSVIGVTDPDGDAVTINFNGVTQDEPVKGAASGILSPDALIQGEGVLIRSERNGIGNGRVYEIFFTAEDGKGGSCTGAVKVGVPHSLKKGSAAIDDGQKYDSTIP
jgi:probable HAF family extracellular repeat protein